MKIKIRYVLLLLTLLFLGASLIIRSSINETTILELDAKNLTNNLNEKEELVNNVFKDSLLLNKFTLVETKKIEVQKIASKYLKDDIYFYIYKNNKPIYWSTNTYVPPTTSDFTRETNLLKTENITFIAKVLKVQNDIELLALIPIEHTSLNSEDYGTKNTYKYLDAENITIADFSDIENIRNIYSKNGNLLFSVKLNKKPYKNIYIELEFLFHTLAVISFVILITITCRQLSKRKNILLPTFTLAIVLILLRILDIDYGLKYLNHRSDNLSTNNKLLNYLIPNTWEFFVNTITVTWFIIYLYSIKKYVKMTNLLSSQKFIIPTTYILINCLYISFIFTFDYLSLLNSNSSNLQQNLSQFIYTNKIEVLHILIYSSAIISLLLFIDFILHIISKLKLKSTTYINLQLIILLQFVLISIYMTESAIISVLIGILIILKTLEKSIIYRNNKYTYLFTLIILALITNIKFSAISKNTLREQMKATITTIESEDDIEAINKFKEIEHKILNDEQLKNLLSISKNTEGEKIINEYLKKKYFNGYISKYEYHGYFFQNETPLGNYSSEILNTFKEKVISLSVKVNETDLFYKSQITGIGVYEYFSIIEIPTSENDITTLILDFTNRNANEFITVLTGGKSFLTNVQITGKVSFAIYNNDRLISQKGNYIYPSQNNEFPKQVNEYINYESEDGYSHVILNNNNQTIVVSKENQPKWQFIAITAVIFLFLYILTIISRRIIFLYKNYLHKKFNLKDLKYRIIILLKNKQYSTRIQTLVISSVFVAIFISGIITFFSIRQQTQDIRINNRLKLIAEISNKLELKALTDNSNNQIEYLHSIMNGLTDVVVTNFNLFDKDGKLFYTTQPKIYETGLLSPYLSTEAFLELSVLKKTETHNVVKISDFEFESSYAPIKNENYNTIAYLAIPYYNSTDIDKESKDILLNTIFNIYTIIIIVFIFLSIYISNKITEPLQIIRKKLTSTNLNNKFNEPLYWERNDEIGLLVKDYNYMLTKLEESADQLREAEREKAWREMAKQVAHEIKNPLTPMKLGIQYLNKAFNENDSNIKERFEKVSSSFIEQINALAHIANEFSNFANLPKPNPIELDLIKKIHQSVEIYKHSYDTTIKIQNNSKHDSILVLADRNQLLRTFNNILKNAIEAASIERHVEITIKIEDLKHNWIKIAITDNGSGIPEELHKNIFNPNFTTKSSGTGLGLVIVKQTITGMGGNIYFETKTNIGTTIFIEMPILDKKQ